MDSLTVGHVIDSRYTLVTRLGEGAFGEVWKARDDKFPNVERFVALKFLKEQHLANRQIVSRFEKEADALAALHDEHVIAVLDRGRWSGGLYIAMEYVAGTTLDQWLEEHEVQERLPDLPSVQSIFDQICAGVAAAHGVTVPGPIVHRDLKPANVLLTATVDGPAIKVLDFGVARLGGRSQETRTGVVIGTEVYMAPEQRLGQSTQIGPCTDVFALGVIFTQMLSLRALPDPGINEPWWCLVGRDETRTRALLGALRSDVPAAVWDVAATALRRDGSQRFADAGELRHAMRGAWGASSRWTPSSPITPRTALMTPRVAPTLPDPKTATARTRSPMRSAGLAIIGLAAIAVVTYYFVGPDAPPPRPTPPPPPPSRSVEPCALDGMVYVPRGEFRMGPEDSDTSAEQHERRAKNVRLSAFCIQEHEVTVAEYRECVRKRQNGVQCSPPKTTVYWSTAMDGEVSFWSRFCNGDKAERNDHPINCVDWVEADTYCRWLGGTLPTEAQWEYAARGSDGRGYPWGNAPPDLRRVNACGSECREMLVQHMKLGRDKVYEGDDGFPGTAPVGHFAEGKSPFGAMDMAGNVWEWVFDKEGSYDSLPEEDPVQTVGKLRVVRGGGWNVLDAQKLRVTYRFQNSEVSRNASTGFRCAAQANPP